MVEAGATPSREDAGERLRRFAEECAGQVVTGRAEAWVVEEVEELASETQPDLFCQINLPLKGDARLCGPESTQHIAAEIALLARWGRSESGDIQDFSARVLRAIEYKRFSGHYVRVGI